MTSSRLWVILRVRRIIIQITPSLFQYWLMLNIKRLDTSGRRFVKKTDTFNLPYLSVLYNRHVELEEKNRIHDALFSAAIRIASPRGRIQLADR